MNIARSLDQPKMTRSQKKLHIRRKRMTLNLLMLLVCMVSGGYALFWTIVGATHLWEAWVVPAMIAVWHTLTDIPVAQWTIWFYGLSWVMVGVGLLASVWGLYRQLRFVKSVATVCFSYSYIGMSYVLWLVVRSFLGVGTWTAVGFVAALLLIYIGILGRVRSTYAHPPQQKVSF